MAFHLYISTVHFIMHIKPVHKIIVMMFGIG